MVEVNSLHQKHSFYIAGVLFSTANIVIRMNLLILANLQILHGILAPLEKSVHSYCTVGAVVYKRVLLYTRKDLLLHNGHPGQTWDITMIILISPNDEHNLCIRSH